LAFRFRPVFKSGCLSPHFVNVNSQGKWIYISVLTFQFERSFHNDAQLKGMSASTHHRSQINGAPNCGRRHFSRRRPKPGSDGRIISQAFGDGPLNEPSV
jgi:hypothetical protein